jgi:hypothetical protein
MPGCGYHRSNVTRDLDLAQRGALLWVPADLMTAEIAAELDQWTKIGFVVLDCGCLWRMDDVDDVHDHEH